MYNMPGGYKTSGAEHLRWACNAYDLYDFHDIVYNKGPQLLFENESSVSFIESSNGR